MMPVTNKTIPLLGAVAAPVLLAACASHPEEIPSRYVSPVVYQDYSCEQLAAELHRVTRRAGELSGHLEQTASNDSAQMAVGLVLFWPALFFLEGGDGAEAAEYASLEGARDALEQAAIRKDCGIEVVPVKAPEEPQAQPRREPWSAG